jgi:hypothetical protein
VEDGVRPQVKASLKKPPTIDQLLKIAEDHEVTVLADTCRSVRKLWRETARWTYGGSYRYWARTPSGAERMVFGVNVAGIDDPPSGQLDVWIPAKSMAEVTGIAEGDLKSVLKTKHPAKKIGFDCWLRLKSTDEAQSLVAQLQAWTGKAHAGNPAIAGG